MAAQNSSRGRFWISLGILFLACSAHVSAETWARTYGGEGDDFASDARPTSDGGFIVVGGTDSFGAGGSDAWVLMLDELGNVLWEKTYGGPGDDTATLVRETSEGKFVVAGGADLSGNTGEPWLFELDQDGNIQWEKRYDHLYGPPVGLEEEPGGLVTGWWVLHGLSVLRLDFSGSIRSEHRYRLEDASAPSVLRPTSDGGFVAVGTTYLLSGEREAWFLKLDSLGDIQWHRVYAGDGPQPGSGIGGVDILEHSDGGFVATGFPGRGWNFWLTRLNAQGEIVWEKEYPSADWESHVIRQTPDGGFVLAGASGQPIRPNLLWILRLDRDGEVVWQEIYGTADGIEYPSSLALLDDGGFIVAGVTDSFGPEGTNVWVLKLDSEGRIESFCEPHFSSWRTSTSIPRTIRDGSGSGTTPRATERDVTSVVADSTAILGKQCGAGCPPLACEEILVDDDTVPAGAPQTFEVRYTGGASPYSVEWFYTGSPTPDAEGNPLTRTLPVGNWDVRARVTDSCLLPLHQTCSASITVCVDEGWPIEVSNVGAGDLPLRVILRLPIRLTVQGKPWATAYNVYADLLGSWNRPSPATGSVCTITDWTPGGFDTIRLDYDLPVNSWVLVTASYPCGEGPAGGDSAGVERTSVGDWTLCGEAP